MKHLVHICLFALLLSVQAKAQSLKNLAIKEVKIVKDYFALGDTMRLSLLLDTDYITPVNNTVYLSKNGVIDAGDVLLYSTSDWGFDDLAILIPTYPSPGDYYLIIKTEYSGQKDDETDNFYIQNIHLHRDLNFEFPDLIPLGIYHLDTLNRNSPWASLTGNAQLNGKASPVPDKVRVQLLIANTPLGNDADTLFNDNVPLYVDTTFYPPDLDPEKERPSYITPVIDKNRITDKHPDGLYYMIEKADPLNTIKEADKQNNTQVKAFHIVTVDNDISVALSSPNSLWVQNGTVYLYAGVKAKGVFPIGFYATLSLYLSKDAQIDGSDRLLGQERYLGKEGSVFDYNKTLTISKDWAPGTYNLIAAVQVEGVKEIDLQNNQVALPLTIADKYIDLSLNLNNSYAPLKTYAGAPLKTTYSVTNQNVVQSLSLPVKWLLSKDSLPDALDKVLVADTFTTALNSSRTITSWPTIPTDVAEGNYFLLGFIDYQNQVQEHNEKNNRVQGKVNVLSRTTFYPISDLAKDSAILCNKTLLFPLPSAPVASKTSVITLYPSTKGTSVQVSLPMYDYQNPAFIVQYYNGKDTLAELLLKPETRWLTNRLEYTAYNTAGVLTLKFTRSFTKQDLDNYRTPFAYEATVVCVDSAKSGDMLFPELKINRAQIRRNETLILDGMAKLGIVDADVSVSIFASSDSLLSADDVLQKGFFLRADKVGKDTVAFKQTVMITKQAPLGNVFLITKVDAANRYGEPNETNNTVTKSITLLPALNVDLRLDSIVLDKQAQVLGERMTGKIRITNLGKDTSGMTIATFQGWDQYVFGKVAVPSVAANQSLWAPFSFVLYESDIFKPLTAPKVSLLVDGYQKIEETNENNNIKNFMLSIAASPRYTFTQNLPQEVISCQLELVNETHWGNPLENSGPPKTIRIKPAEKDKLINLSIDAGSGLSHENISIKDLGTNNTLLEFSTKGQKYTLYSSDTSGFEITYSAGYNYDNNISIKAFCDVPPYLVNDLVLSDLKASVPREQTKGTAYFSIKNIGINFNGPFKVRYYLSEDNTLSADDKVVDSSSYTQNEMLFLVQQSRDFKASIRLPLVIGSQFLIAQLDAPDKNDYSKSTNTSATIIQIDESTSDIRLVYPRPSVHQNSAGDSNFTLHYQLMLDNPNVYFSTQFKLHFTVSKDRFGLTNYLERDYNITMDPNVSVRQFDANYTWASFTQDSSYLIIDADYYQQINETNEENNRIVIPIFKKSDIRPNVLYMPLSGSQSANACNMQLTSPLQNDGYPNNLLSEITLRPSDKQAIQLNFSSFELENETDYLYVYDGEHASTNTLIGKFSGNTLPNVVNSKSGALTLRMTTNGTNTKKGFTTYVDCVPDSLPMWEGDSYATNISSTSSGNNLIVQYTMHPAPMLGYELLAFNTIYYSKDSILDFTDAAIFNYAYGSYNRGAHWLQHTVDLSVLPKTDYYLFLVVDACNLVSEINEDNNVYLLKKIQNITTEIAKETFMRQEMVLFPNPATAHTTITVGGEKVAHAEVFDLTGNRVLTVNTNGVLEVNSLSAGIYLVRAQYEGKWFQSNLIVK